MRQGIAAGKATKPTRPVLPFAQYLVGQALLTAQAATLEISVNDLHSHFAPHVEILTSAVLADALGYRTGVLLPRYVRCGPIGNCSAGPTLADRRVRTNFLRTLRSARVAQSGDRATTVSSSPVLWT